MILQNLHTHTRFGDGKNSAEEMVQAAIGAGFTSLGFSEHSPLPWGTDNWAMPAELEEDYRREIRRLQKAYESELEIFLGMEKDIDSHPYEGPWDYVIGSVHYVWAEGEHRSVDFNLNYSRETVERYFHGDPYAYARAYFQRVAQVVEKTDCQIVGHFDLASKFNENSALFDESHPRYRKAALEALDALAAEDRIFEINTGAMSRGYRTSPYPSKDLLKAMKERGCRICITSDCHSAAGLTHAFDLAEELAKSCGFRERWVLTGKGFIPQKL